MNDGILETKRIRKAREFAALARAESLGPCGDQLAKQMEEELSLLEDTSPRLLERDHIPASVATDMLCNSQAMSGPFRRQCMRAREKHYVSAQTREAQVYKIARRFSRSTLQQLDKWLRRAIQKRRDLAAVIRSKHMRAKPEQIPVAMTALLEARAEACTQAIDTITTEINSRTHAKD